MDLENAQMLAREFCRTLEVASATSSLTVYPETILPSSKDNIIEAIKSLMLYCVAVKDAKGIEVYKMAYIQLASFINKDTFKSIQFPILSSNDQERQNAVSVFKKTVINVAEDAKKYSADINEHISNCVKKLNENN